MSKVPDLSCGVSLPNKTLWHSLEVENVTLPLFTDKYLINDVVFYLVSDWLDYAIQGVDEDLYAYMDSELEDYVEAMLEPEDHHILNDIVKQVIDRAKKMVNHHQFDYLKNSMFEINKIEYRYDSNEKYVRWYITLG